MEAHQRRWPATLAVLVVIALQFLLPDQLRPPWWPAVVAVEVLMLAPLVATNPVGLRRDHPALRVVGIVLAVTLLVVNATRLAEFIVLLFDGGRLTARELVGIGLLAWSTNVVATAVLYWELDRGGPFARDPRHDRDDGEIDLLFPQQTGVPGVDAAAWRPSFVDYLFVAFTSATAFSPTDAMPLTGRAKLLMGFAASVSLITIAGVAARAVNVL